MRNCNNNTLFAGCSFCSLQYERDMNIYNFFNYCCPLKLFEPKN